jgi:dihydroxy-acid dehydratase
VTKVSDWRSQQWINGDDEVSLAHRVALRAAGSVIDPVDPRPVIGIADSSSDLNPCNLPLSGLAGVVADAVREAGGVPVRFPVMSLGEDLMKPTAMLYRNLLAMEVEEYLRAYPIDGVVLLANCDKSVPGALMGAFATNLPTLMLTAGPRPPAQFEGRRIGTGTDLWRAWDDHRAGRLSDQQWAQFERCLDCGLGSCNTMGTAASMAVVAEALGVCWPGSATIPAAAAQRVEVAAATGRRIVDLVRRDARPAELVTAGSFANAVRLLNAVGGSTNAVLHLLAIAGRTTVRLTLDDVARLSRDVPVLADVEPSGTGLVQDLDAVGGVPALVRELGDLIDAEQLTASGQTWGEVAADSLPASGVIRPRSDALRADGAFAVVRGSLAPDGAVVKVSAATPALLHHRGRAVVFDSYDDMRTRIDDPTLLVDADSVLVLRGAGPVGAPGMPEWGMIPIPARLVAAGITDMVRVSDARMSGTSFGTCVLHVAPEAAVGGPLALVREGDEIELDVTAERLDLHVADTELAERAADWTAPPRQERGWPALYQRHVLQADRGCDLDFLTVDQSRPVTLVGPTVGRS